MFFTRASMAVLSPAPSMIVVSSLPISMLLGATEVLQRGVFQLQAEFFGDDRTAGEDRDVFQHGLAPIAEARRLDGAGLEDAADVVDDQRRQRFAVDVFGDDQQRLAGLGDLLEQRQQIANVADLLVVQQDQRVVDDARLACPDC